MAAAVVTARTAYGARRRQVTGTVWQRVSSTASGPGSRKPVAYSRSKFSLGRNSRGRATAVSRAASRPSATVGGSSRTRRSSDPNARMCRR
jgi:hypothetical protein